MTSTTLDTPFGPATLHVCSGGSNAAVVLQAAAERERRDGVAVRAAIYGAKLAGIARVVEIVTARPIDRLLAETAYVVPHDLVDLTFGDYLTFFTGKGYGFLPQHTPFCPDMRAALITAGRSADPRSCSRGVVAALENWQGLAEAGAWGAHLGGLGVSPAAFLARELELCYVPLCMLAPRDDVQQVIERMLPLLPEDRRCPCATAMVAARERGLVGEDWRTWLP